MSGHKMIRGVWGPWSPTWSFTPRGPTPPRDVALEFDLTRNRGVLRWAPDPRGEKPVAYRVYASDEKGFSVSDRPYKVTVGTSDQVPSDVPRELRGRNLGHGAGGGGPRRSNSRARTRRSTAWSPWTRRASGAGLPTTPSRPGRSL